MMTYAPPLLIVRFNSIYAEVCFLRFLARCSLPLAALFNYQNPPDELGSSQLRFHLNERKNKKKRGQNPGM
jgi:hypothetical protein